MVLKLWRFIFVGVLTLVGLKHGEVNLEWVRAFNGLGNGDDYAKRLYLLLDSCIFVVGDCWNGATNKDYAILKYDLNGNLLWNTYYNGIGNGEDRAIACIADENYTYVTGYSWNGTSFDIVTIKYNSTTGEMIWEHRFDGPIGGDDRPVDITRYGDYIYVAGYTYNGSPYYYDYVLLNLDSATGQLVWVNSFDLSNGEDKPSDMEVDNQGYIYVTGEGYGNVGHYNYLTLKYDSSGNLIWYRTYNGPANHYDHARAIAVDNSGNVYVTGQSRSSESYYDYLTIKYDANGSTQWIRRYTGPGGAWGIDEALDIGIDQQNNVYVTGRSMGDGTGYDYATLKYSQTGELLWVARYNGQGNGTDWARALTVDNLGNVYVTGYSYSGTNYDIVTIKYDENGNVSWIATYNGPANQADEGFDIAIDNNRKIYVTGYTQAYFGGTGDDFILIKYSQPTQVGENNSQLPAFTRVYPNPFSNQVTISLSLPRESFLDVRVYDIMGRVIKVIYSDKISENHKTLTWDGTDEINNPLTSGIYFLRIRTQDFSKNIILNLTR